MKPFVYKATEYLAEQSDRFTFNVENANLLVGELIQGENGVYSIATSGLIPENETTIEHHIIEFWAKNKSTGVAFDDLADVKKIFHRAEHYNIGDYYVYLSQITGEIADFDKDAEGRKVLKINVHFIIRNTNLIS